MLSKQSVSFTSRSINTRQSWIQVWIQRFGFRIIGSLALNSVFQSPRFHVLQAKISCISDSTSKNFVDSGIRVTSHGAETLRVYLFVKTCEVALLCWLISGFFVLTVLRHSWVSQVFKPRMSRHSGKRGSFIPQQAITKRVLHFGVRRTRDDLD